MAEYQCTCHCGGDMFYRHMHAESCPLSIYGDEVPGTEVDTLKRQVADLTAQVEAQNAEIRDMRKSIDTAAKGIVRLTTERDDLTRRLEEAQQKCDEFFKEWKACRDAMRGKVNDPDPLVPCGDERELTLYGMVSGVLRSRDALQAKLAAVGLERDTTRTALLALPVAQEVLQSIMQAWQHKSHDQEVGSFHFWFSANIEQFDAALLRLAQAMRGR